MSGWLPSLPSNAEELRDVLCKVFYGCWGICVAYITLNVYSASVCDLPIKGGSGGGGVYFRGDRGGGGGGGGGGVFSGHGGHGGHGGHAGGSCSCKGPNDELCDRHRAPSCPECAKEMEECDDFELGVFGNEDPSTSDGFGNDDSGVLDGGVLGTDDSAGDSGVSGDSKERKRFGCD